MSIPYFSGPIAPERNPPIEPQNFKPSLFPITAISYGTSTTVTTGTAFGVSNNYVVGQSVRFNIPKTYGAQQLTGQSGNVISIPGPDQVIVGINTSQGYDPFNPSPPYGPTPPQIAAIGDVNSGALNRTPWREKTYIPGSFINISPVQAG